MGHKFILKQTYDDLIHGKDTLEMDGQICQEAKIVKEKKNESQKI